MSDSHRNTTGLRILTAYLLQTVKQKGVVGDNHLATGFYSLSDNGFRYIRRQQHRLNFRIAIAHLKPRIVPLLLPPQRGCRLYDINNVPNEQSISMNYAFCINPSSRQRPSSQLLLLTSFESLLALSGRLSCFHLLYWMQRCLQLEQDFLLHLPPLPRSL